MTDQTAMLRHDPEDLIRLFNGCFQGRERTILVRGGDEPLYQPADRNCPYHRVIFAHGFYASALHEIAHWCIAGPERRLQVDYGYWYKPDGRSAAEQADFQRVEARPQALEWVFSLAAGFRFHVSVDNLSGAPIDVSGFRRRVHRAALDYRDRGLPPRARCFVAALEGFYAVPWHWPEAIDCE